MQQRTTDCFTYLAASNNLSGKPKLSLDTLSDARQGMQQTVVRVVPVFNRADALIPDHLPTLKKQKPQSPPTRN